MGGLWGGKSIRTISNLRKRVLDEDFTTLHGFSLNLGVSIRQLLTFYSEIKWL